MDAIRVMIDAIARWSLYAFAFLLPVFFIPGGYTTIAQGKLLLVASVVGILVVCWFTRSLVANQARIPRHATFFAVLMLPLAYIVSSFVAGWSTSSLVSGLAEQDTIVTVSLWFSCIFLSTLTLSRQTDTLVAFIRSLVLGFAALLVFQTARLFFADLLLFGGTFPNNTVTLVGSWHDFGIVLSLAVLLCGALLRTRFAGTGVWRILFAATALGSFVFLVVVSVQDVWFVLAALSALFGAYVWYVVGKEEEATSRDRMLRAGIWFVVAVIACTLGWFTSSIHDRLPPKLQVVSIEVRPSWEGTLQVSEDSLRGSRSLLFGSGPNSFARNWALHKPTTVNSTLFWNFDFSSGVGIVPTSFITIGVFGILAWILIVLGFLFSAVRALVATRHFGATQTTVFSFVCVILLLIIFHIIYIPSLSVSTLLFLLLGAFIALPLSDASRPSFTLSFGLGSIGRFVSFLFVGIVACVIVAVAATGVRAVVSDVYLNKSIRSYAETQDAAVARAYIERSLSMWPFNDRAHRAAVELGILKLAQLSQQTADGSAQEQLQSTLTSTIEHGLAAVSIDGADYQNWLTLAQLYQELAGVGVQGAYEEAQNAYNSARTENPTSPLPLLRLAQLEIARGNRAAAIQHLDDALALKPNYAIGYFLRSQLYAEEGRFEEATDSATAVVQIVPGDPLGWYNLGSILYLQSNWTDAATVFSQAVTLREDYSNAIFLLGLSLYNMGDTDRALLAFERVRELNPQDSTVSVIIENIRAGREPLEGLSS